MIEIYLISRSGYGIAVKIDPTELEQLKKLLESGDPITSIEE